MANLVGIPVGTYLSQEFSWRYTFLLIAVFNIAVLTAIFFWVPDIRDKAQGSLREQFHFLRSPAPCSFSPPRCSAMRAFLPGSAISSHL